MEFQLKHAAVAASLLLGINAAHAQLKIAQCAPRGAAAQNADRL